MAEVEGKTIEQWRSYTPMSLGHAESMPVFDDPAKIVDAETMWANYFYFMDRVLPVAEAAGVKLALHADDPPVPMLGGVARIFKEPADFKRAYERYAKSPAWGLDLCLGCCSEMPGGAVQGLLRMGEIRG